MIGSRQRGAFTLTALVIVTALMALIGGGIYWQWQSQNQAGATTSAILHTVAEDDFTLIVTERGEIQSGGVTEIKSEVKSKNTPGLAILRIVPEGTRVSEGDFLVELDSSALQEELTTQRIAVNTSNALVVEAQNVYETAVIAKREYLDGTYVQEQQTIESEIFVAEENLNRAKEYYEYSKKLAAKGYVNELQLEADRFAVEKSQKELEAAQTKRRVLADYTKAKMLKQLESNIVIAKSKWDAEKNSHGLELQKLREIEDQVAKTVITSPRDGVVTYAHETDYRGNEEFVVEEGAVIRERQTIIKLPDPSSMRVELTVNEALIQFVKPGMPAQIRPVGLGKTVLGGTVETVNQYAEPSGWRKANVKEYKAFVRIEATPPGLRSGMTASVSIECLREDAVVQTPVQSVYLHGKNYFCFVFENGRWNARPVVVGPTNDKFFVVRDGLDIGQQVAMNPKRYLDKVDLPDLPPEGKPERPAAPTTAQAPGNKLRPSKAGG